MFLFCILNGEEEKKNPSSAELCQFWSQKSFISCTIYSCYKTKCSIMKNTPYLRNAFSGFFLFMAVTPVTDGDVTSRINLRGSINSLIIHN